MKDLILVMIGAILANNYVLTAFMGTETVGRDADKSTKAIVCTGLATTVVLVVATLITQLLEVSLLAEASYLQTLVYAIVVLLVVYVAEAVARMVKKGHESVLPVVLNSVVLGGCLVYASKGYTLPQALLASVGTGLGYLLASLAVAGVRERINDKYVPQPFRGFPITVAAMAIIALAVYAF